MKKNNQLYFDGCGLLDKMKKTISFIREHEPQEGYFVGFSGGKDSIVLLELVKMSGVKYEAYFSDTGLEHKEVYAFIKKYYPDVQWLKPKISFWEGVKRWGPPWRTARWCCTHLKKNPSKNHPLKIRLMGIRAEESHQRRKRGQISEYKGITTIKPLFNWFEWEIWQFIEDYNFAYPSLYDGGHKRIGCQVCPFARKTLQEDSPHQRALKRCSKQWYDKCYNNRKEEYGKQEFEEFWNNYINQ